MFQEFKKFINRGNVMDLAVAVILGAAFNAIVGSLVEDIITPLVGIFMGGIDLTAVGLSVGNAFLGIGNFIQAVLDFLVIAIVVFLIVRTINRIQGAIQPEDKQPEEKQPEEKQAEEKQAEASGPPEDIILLTEIRDLLSRN